MPGFTVGTVRVQRVEEQEGLRSRPEDLFSDFDRAVFDRHLPWLAPRFYDPAAGRLISSFHSWVIRTRRHTIIVDTCAGNDRNRPNNPGFHHLQTPYLERLAQAGVDPAKVDFVLCTHLHADHCGWNTRLQNGRWVPTFPNARYVFSEAELAAADPRRHALPPGDVNLGVFEDSVLPILEAGLALTVGGRHALDDEAVIEPAPGHTAGSVVLRIGRAGPQGLLTGDVMHSPIQVACPDWNSRFCDIPDLARHTRRNILQACADRDVLLLPAHFGAPYATRIQSTADGWRCVFAE